MRRGRLIVLVGVVLVLGGWIGIWAFGEWQYRSELRQAAEDFAGRRYSESGERLARLAVRWPGRAEVEYWLGTCKLKEGNREAALEAWGRIPDDSPEAPAVAMARAGLALELFRYGLAEACLKRAIRGGGEKSDEARRLLGRVYWVTGRRDEYRRLLQKDAERARDPSDMLRTFWSLDHDPYKVDSITEALGKAKRSAPNDDRVWLALADLATRSAIMRKPANGSRAASRPGPMTSMSGTLAFDGRKPRIDPMRFCERRLTYRLPICPKADWSRFVPGSRRGLATARLSGPISKNCSSSSRRISQRSTAWLISRHRTAKRTGLPN